MSVDSIYGSKHSDKTLEQRARENGNAIDEQWIKENELWETQHSTQILEDMPGGLDPDLKEELNRKLYEIENEKEDLLEKRKHLTEMKKDYKALLDENLKKGEELIAMMEQAVSENDDDLSPHSR